MWANSVWGFFTLGVGFLLAMLTLSPEQTWLRPWLLGVAIASYIFSVAILFWPLRHTHNRKRFKEAFLHPRKWLAENLRPRHLIILGLTGVIVFAAIALAGVIWQ